MKKKYLANKKWYHSYETITNITNINLFQRA